MNRDYAEEGVYWSIHDAAIGGVLCPKTGESLVWEQTQEDGEHVMRARSEGILYVLRESTNYRLEIIPE